MSLSPRAAKRWYYAGYATASVSVAAIPAGFIEAVWSGDWRWLLAMVPGWLMLRWALRGA